MTNASLLLLITLLTFTSAPTSSAAHLKPATSASKAAQEAAYARLQEQEWASALAQAQARTDRAAAAAAAASGGTGTSAATAAAGTTTTAGAATAQPGTNPFNACPGFSELAAFVDKQKHSMCKIGPTTGGLPDDPAVCLRDTTLVPCHMMAANLFYAYSGKKMATVRHHDYRLPGPHKKLIEGELRLMQSANKPQVYAFEVGLDGDYPPCGGVHLFTVVVWPSHGQSGAHNTAASPSSQTCIFQSFGARSKHASHMWGYSLRQWFYGWDVAHPEQQNIRLPHKFGNGIPANKQGFDTARQHSMRATATFAQLFQQLLDPQTLPDAFEELFGCRPHPIVNTAAGTSRSPQLSSVLVWQAPATLSGFASLEAVMSLNMCRHETM